MRHYLRPFSASLVALAWLSVVGAFARADPPDSRAQEEDEYFEEETPAVSFRTVWDFRFVSADTTTSWLDAGLGKTRYGGEEGARRNLFRVPQASFVVATDSERPVSGHFHVNLDLEPETPGGRFGWDRLRIIEGFVNAKWAFAEPLELRVKGGLFFPHISLEHIGEAWTTFYTLTPSAINAWVGEEVRALGTEISLAHVGLENEVALSGAVFWNNDPTGSLLAYRGFALHDRQTGLRDRLPLPPIPSLRPGGDFEEQAPWAEPVLELDGRAGYFGSVSWDNYRYFQVNALYFDNKGIPDTFENGQYAWHTRFVNAGAVVFLPGDLELLGQYLSGDTLMGFEPPGARVAADYRSWYAMLSVPYGRHRFSTRFETFRTRDRDAFDFPDSSDENGDAMTFAYWLSLGGAHRLGAELLRVASDRPARASIGEAVSATEWIFQLDLRLQF